MAEIAKEFIKKRNKILLELKDSCCGWAEELLEQIEQATEINSLSLIFAPFVDHATNADCSLCRGVLTKANIEAKKAMEY